MPSRFALPVFRLVAGTLMAIAPLGAGAQALPATPNANVAAAVQTVTAPAPNFAGNMLQLFLGLAVVLALMVGALWLLKQITQRRGTASGLLKVVAGTAVGPRERVVIVEVGSTWLVLGVAPGRVTPLAEVPRQAAATPPATGTTIRRSTSADLAASFAAAVRPPAGGA